MSPSDEDVLARSSAPTTISADADVLRLTRSGYEIASRGSNGFVCLVERSWNSAFSNAEFWNPKVRAPICYNPIAARWVLPGYLERTRLALAGTPLPAMEDAARRRVRAAAPQAGAMSYMMSKDSYLGDAVGHAHPHLMFYVDDSSPAVWGADLEGSPVSSFVGGPDSPTVFLVSVKHWSDGSSAMSM